MQVVQQQHFAFMERLQPAPQAIATAQAPSPSIAPLAKIIFWDFPVKRRVGIRDPGSTKLNSVKTGRNHLNSDGASLERLRKACQTWMSLTTHC